MNYTQLSAQIKAFCENTFPSTTGGVSSDDQVAQFVRNAEQRIYNEVQLPTLRKTSTTPLSTGNRYQNCPSDFLAVHSFAVLNGTDYEYLLNKDVNFLREAYPSTSTTGTPKYYSIYGPQDSDEDELKFVFAPPPDANYPTELIYFYYPTSIVDAGTSWLGDNFDTALLYGAIVEAYVYMKGEQDIIAQYTNQYKEALSSLKQLGDGKDRQDSYRNGQVRIPVR